MSKDYEINISAHPNIYNNLSPRHMNIYFSEPDKGVNNETGLLLLISGFGANANSKVYKKMRTVFADKYNLVTIQCDYFGWEFMQDKPLLETTEYFNDMGVMQALDNITAVLTVVEIIRDNNLTFNTKKIMAYGHSHGAYLAYLSNIFAPHLFSLIIDNSSWLFPLYLQGKRYLNYINGDRIVFNYYASSVVKDIEIIYLPFLYTNFENYSVIHSFHGNNDNLISLTDKRNFCRSFKNCFLHEITTNNVDNRIFKSTMHGLNADFLLLFDYVITNFSNEFENEHTFSIENQRIETKQYTYLFDYSGIVPVLKRDAK